MRKENVYGLAVGNYEEDLMIFVQEIKLCFFHIMKSLDSEIILEKVDKAFIEGISIQIEDYASLEDKIEKGFEIYVFLLEEHDKNIKLPFFYEDAIRSRRKKADLKSAIISNKEAFSQGEFLSSFEDLRAAF